MKKILKRGALLAFGLTLSFLLAEVALRIRNPFYSTVRGGRVVLQANRTFRYPGAVEHGTDEQIVYRTNGLGFRGPELPEGGLADRTSVIAIGGSTTNCQVLNEEKAWPGVLRGHLEARFPEAWLNNAGMDGHTTFAHQRLLEDYVVQLKPDICLFLIGINDVSRGSYNAFDRGNVRDGLDFGSFKGFVKSVGTYSEVVSLGVNLVRWRRAKRSGLPYKPVSIASAATVPPDAPEAVTELLVRHRSSFLEGFEERVRKLVATCRAAGIEPVLITQPALYGDRVDPATGVNLALVRPPGGEALSGSTRWRLLEVYNDVTRAIAAEEGALLVDLARELPKDSRLYFDFIHFNNVGSERVAAIVWSHLEQRFR